MSLSGTLRQRSGAYGVEATSPFIASTMLAIGRGSEVASRAARRRGIRGPEPIPGRKIPGSHAYHAQRSVAGVRDCADPAREPYHFVISANEYFTVNAGGPSTASCLALSLIGARRTAGRRLGQAKEARGERVPMSVDEGLSAIPWAV